jgi:hypothetical protein
MEALNLVIHHPEGQRLDRELDGKFPDYMYYIARGFLSMLGSAV